jgi:hypothetical protein
MSQYPNFPDENKPVNANQYSVPILKTPEDCIGFASKINPKREELTTETLRRFPGCEQYTEEEAIGIVQSIHQLTAIIFKAIYEGDSILIGNPRPDQSESESIPINSNHTKNLAA